MAQRPPPTLQLASTALPSPSFLELVPGQDPVLLGTPNDAYQVSALVNALVLFLVFLAPMTDKFRGLNDTVMMPLFLTMVMGGL